MVPCDRCGVKFDPKNPQGCSQVPPDRQQRFHIHVHRYDHSTGKCLVCDVPDERMVFQVMYHLTTINPEEMTPAQYREASRMTMRQEGNMMYDLRIAYKNDHKYRVIVMARLYQMRDDHGLLVGQALLDVSRARVQKQNWNPFGQFYVRKTHRRNGLGTIMMAEMLHFCTTNNLGSLRVSRWSDGAREFFDTFDPQLVHSYDK